MKNINNYFKLTILSLFLVTACEEDYLPQPNDADITVAYISELQSTNTLRVSVNDNGGETSITPRLSKLSSGEASFSIQSNQQVLDEYNKKNGTKYEMLPENAFNFVNASTGEKGKTVNIKLANKEFGSKIRVEIGEMVDASGNKLPVAKSYAIPVLMTNVDANRYVNTKEGKSGILLLDREFTSTALRIDRSGGILVKVKDEKNVERFENSTVQFSVYFSSMNDGAGLVWPYAPRDKQIYQIMYGGGLTLFTTAGGKVGFNQPDFLNFKFKTNKWYHCSLVMKVEKGIPYLMHYVNGNLAYSGPWTGILDWSVGVAFASDRFNGYMREIRVWNRALNQNEVNSTMLFADPSSEGLKLYLPLNNTYKYENIAPNTKDVYSFELQGKNVSDNNQHFKDSFTFP